MKLGTSTECLLGTLEPSATLPLLETPFLNLYLELSLGTSELGTSWNFETFQNLSLEALVAWNLHLKPDLEPLLGPLSWNLATFQNQTVLGTLEPSKPVLGTRVFVDLLDPSLATTWNPCSEPRNLLEPFMIGTLTWNLGTCRNLYLEPLYLEPRNLRNLTWNPYLEPRNLPEPLLGTLILGTSEPSEPYLEPLLGTSEPAGTFTWNPYSEPRNLPEPLLRTLTWNLGARRNLYLEPLLGTSEPAGTFTWNPYLEPWNLPEPLLGTLTWNLGTCQNLAGWLPQSAPGLSLARTPKLSAVGEKYKQNLSLWTPVLTDELDIERSRNPQSLAELLRDALHSSMRLDKEPLRRQEERGITAVNASVPWSEDISIPYGLWVCVSKTALRLLDFKVSSSLRTPKQSNLMHTAHLRLFLPMIMCSNLESFRQVSQCARQWHSSQDHRCYR